MSQTIWRSSVVHVGEGAAEMFDAGVFIFFGQPVPDALAEISLVHSGPEDEFAPMQVGEMRYDAIVVPGCETLRSSTLDRLEAFRRSGGELIFLGNAPALADALPSQLSSGSNAGCAP